VDISIQYTYYASGTKGCYCNEVWWIYSSRYCL